LPVFEDRKKVLIYSPGKTVKIHLTGIVSLPKRANFTVLFTGMI
jgi:hypothetical protein